MIPDKSNSHIYILVCQIPVEEKNFGGFAGKLEIDLPCKSCERCHRAISFENIGDKGKCLSGKKGSGFFGKMTKLSTTESCGKTVLHFEVAFPYSPFIDKKYRTLCLLEDHKWARIYFRVLCAGCGNVSTVSTQENQVRPWVKKCRCGNTLYKELENPFEYSMSYVSPSK